MINKSYLKLNLSQEDWSFKLSQDDNAVVLDVRTLDELKTTGIIPGAVHLDFYLGHHFIEELETLERDKNYYVYCRSGVRSAQTCGMLNNIGIANAFNLTGGILEWQGELKPYN